MSQQHAIQFENREHLRGVTKLVHGKATSDGAGVQLRRMIATPELKLLDPFLLLDVFRSDDPNDYVAGFPPHPHRGFETVTYLLAGCVRHRDSAGHEGVIKTGGVQWMTAGRGIEHSEMPQQEQGLLHGFQLWVNLPAAAKMVPPRYQEFEPEVIPLEQRDSGVTVRVIAGTTSQGTTGPVREIAAEPIYLDVSLPANSHFQELIPMDHNAFVYLIDGSLRVNGWQSVTLVEAGELAVLAQGDRVSFTADADSRLLLVAGRPLNEPIARQGPFVMNTRQEVEQAYADYSKGLFGHVDEEETAA